MSTKIFGVSRNFRLLTKIIVSTNYYIYFLQYMRFVAEIVSLFDIQSSVSISFIRMIFSKSGYKGSFIVLRMASMVSK